jgi:hypothetical protein
MQSAQAGQQNVNQHRDRNQGRTRNLFGNKGPVMKLYFLYLLVSAIAILAHLGARQNAEADAQKTPI